MKNYFDNFNKPSEFDLEGKYLILFLSVYFGFIFFFFFVKEINEGDKYIRLHNESSIHSIPLHDPSKSIISIAR